MLFIMKSKKSPQPPPEKLRNTSSNRKESNTTITPDHRSWFQKFFRKPEVKKGPLMLPNLDGICSGNIQKFQISFAVVSQDTDVQELGNPGLNLKRFSRRLWVPLNLHQYLHHFSYPQNKNLTLNKTTYNSRCCLNILSSLLLKVKYSDSSGCCQHLTLQPNIALTSIIHLNSLLFLDAFPLNSFDHICPGIKFQVNKRH